MGRLSKSERLAILKQIDLLLVRGAKGENVDDEFKRCADLLGWEKTKEWRPQEISEEKYQKYLRIARQNDIPPHIFKIRMRRGKDPYEAATMPYFQKPKQDEEYFFELAAKNGISRNTYLMRRIRGWDELKSATRPIKKSTDKKEKKRKPGK